MKLEQSFDIKAPLDEVWAALIDVERVAPCLPGAEVTESAEDGVYHGTFQVRLGPTTAAYKGTLKMVSLDEQQHVATMSANAQEKRGQGSAKATMVSTMTEADGGTRVEVVTDFTLTGKLARFGRGGMIQDVSNRLLRDFSKCLQSTLETSEAGADAHAEADAAPTRAAAPTAAPPTGTAVGDVAAADTSVTVPGATDTADELHRIRLELAALRRAVEALGTPSRPAPPQAKPISAVGLLFGVLVDRVKRLLGRPA